MSYNPSIPQANDDPSDSQLQLLNNFSSLNTQFNVNHIPFSAAVNRGYHTKIFFPDGVPDPNLISPLSSLYTKIVAGKAQLFFQNNSNASDVVQLTNLPITTTGTNYAFKTPWGLTIECGKNNTLNYNYQIGFNPVYSLLITSASPTIVNLTAASSNTSFTVSSATDYYYFAIGKSV